MLNLIEGPEDLKNLSLKQLEALAKEIRQRIVSVLEDTGGHMASNLGTVELTIALHKVFNSPMDKMIFDVSHQSYAHKLLTGRNKRFDTLRQFEGACGFTSPDESPHDHFHGGHAGVALSLALGCAKGRDLNNKNEFILPIIGDGTLTCGMSLEALNNIPKDLKKFIIILNDNEMSISKNVGAISRILGKIMNNPTLNKFYNDLENLVTKIPNYGDKIVKQGHRLKSSLQHMTCTPTFFDHYDLDYFGPIDGHDIRLMSEIFELVRHNHKPTIVHLVTKKGKGVEEAVANPTSYHGVSPFVKSPSKKRKFPKIFGEHILKMAESDPSIVTVTPAMTSGSCLEELMERFPERCLDVGIAESHAITFCGGIAKNKNMKVVASIYSSFLQRAFDNLYHDVCMQGIPVVFAIDRAGLAGNDGMSHNGIYDISFLNAMPNMIISQPRNGQVLKELLESAFSWNAPAAIRYPNQVASEPEEPLKKRSPGMGSAEILSQGEDVLILALGTMCDVAMQVKELGINATVVDPVFVKPLDANLMIDLISSHDHIVTIEEHALSGGFGSIVNDFIVKNGLKPKHVWNFGIPDKLVKHGKHKDILESLGLTAENIFSFLSSKIKVGAVR